MGKRRVPITEGQSNIDLRKADPSVLLQNLVVVAHSHEKPASVSAALQDAHSRNVEAEELPEKL